VPRVEALLQSAFVHRETNHEMTGAFVLVQPSRRRVKMSPIAFPGPGELPSLKA
jgi:hypothetical protein